MSNPVDDQLLIEEYKSCRELIGKNIDIMEKNEVFVVGAVAAVFGFILTSFNQKENPAPELLVIAAGWLPLILAVLGFVRFLGLDDVIDKINSYFIELEKNYSIKWTTYYRCKNREKVLKRTRYWFWRFLIALCLLFGVYMTMHTMGWVIEIKTGRPSNGN